MDDSPKTLEKKELPDNIRRELRKGETIYHSLLANHVSKKFPEGKWIVDVRRDEGRTPVRYPIKGFGTPRDALIYVRSLRPDAKGNFTSSRPKEPTLGDLYTFVVDHRHKRLSQRTIDNKEIRWRLHIEHYWADWKLSDVTRRAAQEWVTEVEEKIADGQAGELGLSQFEKVRADLHALFEAIGSFSEAYEEKRIPSLPFRSQRLKQELS